MATIKKKDYTVSSADYVSGIKALLSTAAELLGNEWEFSIDGENPTLKKKTPSGDYGWLFHTTTSDAPRILIAGHTYVGAGRGPSCVDYAESSYTCVVWEGDNGSVGIGQVKSGRIKITLVMAKFTGTYDENDVYALGNRVREDGEYSLKVLGDVDIGAQINMTARIEGTGVYLHPLLDPTTGLSCSDVFGVQCVDSNQYINPGLIIKQGTNSYMSILGHPVGDSTNNVLFVKL